MCLAPLIPFSSSTMSMRMKSVRQNYAVTELRYLFFLAPPALQKCNLDVTFLSSSACYLAMVRFLNPLQVESFLGGLCSESRAPSDV